MLPIVISTYKRESREQQTTFFSIPENLRDRVFVFCRESRKPLLEKACPEMNIHTIPDDTDIGIASTRQTVLDSMLSKGHDRVWMVDDKLKFSYRDSADNKLKSCKTDEDFMRIYEEMNNLSKKYAMVSLSNKKDAALIGEKLPDGGVKECGRAYANYALQLNVLKENGVRFDGMWQQNNEIRMMEDFYVVCSLLSKGIPNAITMNAGFDHKVGEAGGNSTLRSQEMQERCCRFLHSLFPQHVKLVTKDSNWGDLNETRVDVTVQWKKLFEYGSSFTGSSLEEFF